MSSSAAVATSITKPKPSFGLGDDTNATLHLPRILCLHGGGVNARIFKAQLRSFLAHAQLKRRFRFVFVDAPFLCDEGVGVHPVYSDYGPFRRWFRWLESHPTIDADRCRSEIDSCLQSGMDEDEGSGEWVGVLGFSQGAKLAASLLYRQQFSSSPSSTSNTERWKFGIIFAGRAPLTALDDEAETKFPWMQSAGGLPDAADMDAILDRPEMRLSVPTVHVHGLKDEGLHLHRICVDNYCAPGTTWLVEWDGPHRLPLKRVDVDRVVEAIVEVADEYGIGTTGPLTIS